MTQKQPAYPPNNQRALFVTTVPVTLSAFLLPIAAELQSAGWTVDALAADATTWEPIAGRFSHVYDAGWSRSLSSLLRYPITAHQIKKLVLANQYDIIHVHTPIASMVTRLTLRRFGRFGGYSPRIIYTAHGFHFYDGQSPFKNWIYRNIEMVLAAWTDDVVTINEQDYTAARKVMKHSPCPMRKICVTQAKTHGKRCARTRTRISLIEGVGVDLAYYDRSGLSALDAARIRSNVGVPSDSCVITMIAEMNANKRTYLAIEALALIADKVPSAHLVLVGTGPLESALKALVDARGLVKRVTFTGQVTPEFARDIARISDVGILASEREGLPRSLMELVAAGAVICGTRTRGIVDEVLDERALATEATPGAVAEMLELLICKPELAQEIASAQLAHARAHYELSTITSRYMDIYNSARKENE